MTDIGIGDVLAVKSDGIGSLLTRLGAALEDKPNVSNHIAVVHHKDSQGRWWVIQGQPGGVGYAQAGVLLSSSHTLNNAGQPGRTDADRAALAKMAEAMLGTPYDWQTIANEAIRAFAPRAKSIWNQDWKGTGLAPGHVICSSFAAWLYKSIGWHYPTQCDVRDIEPADWDEFVLENEYNAKLSDQ